MLALIATLVFNDQIVYNDSKCQFKVRQLERIIEYQAKQLDAQGDVVKRLLQGLRDQERRFRLAQKAWEK